jgi:ABC-type phosphate/phosphonate transport system substrate-binding protein
MAQAPEQKSNNTSRSNGSETVPLSDAEKKASAPPNNANNLVALLMARPEIKSVSDLTNKKIAIDDRQSASNDSVRTAIAAAGATEVQLSSGQRRAIDRLISGEVPAAVLTSAYPETSEWFPEIAGFKIFRIPLSPRSSQARLETAGKAATGSDSPPTKIAVSPPMAAAVDPGSRTIQERVAAATALAEHVTAASATPAAQKEASNAEASGRTEALPPSDTEPTASVPTNKTDDLVALMMARPEIKLVSDLTGKEVAIDYQQSGPGTSIRTAIAAAGAVEVQLNQGHTKAIDRLIAGEVPAAILTLVSPEAAEWFPDIPGYRIFRIPLSPRSLKTRL